MTVGPYVEKLRPAEGGCLPRALADEPPIGGYEERFYLAAFHNLITSRAIGFGVGPIPISEILAYCEMFHIDGDDERDDMLYYISELDAEYLLHTNKTKPKEGRKA